MLCTVCWRCHKASGPLYLPSYLVDSPAPTPPGHTSQVHPGLKLVLGLLQQIRRISGHEEQAFKMLSPFVVNSDPKNDAQVQWSCTFLIHIQMEISKVTNRYLARGPWYKIEVHCQSKPWSLQAKECIIHRSTVSLWRGFDDSLCCICLCLGLQLGEAGIRGACSRHTPEYVSYRFIGNICLRPIHAIVLLVIMGRTLHSCLSLRRRAYTVAYRTPWQNTLLKACNNNVGYRLGDVLNRAGQTKWSWR